MNLRHLSEQVGQRLLEKQLWLATAESCTGGWISQSITDIAGSSQWFDRGFVTYSNEAKQDKLTQRRNRVLSLLDKGQEPKEIAAELDVSVRTIKRDIAAVSSNGKGAL